MSSLLHRLAETAAAGTGRAALHCEGRELDHAGLHARVRRAGDHLRRQGVAPGERVGVCLQKGLEQVLWMLGILEAGGVLVPMHPAHPPEQLRWIVRHAGMALLVAGQTEARRLGDRLPCPILRDREIPAGGPGGELPPAGGRGGDDPAVILYVGRGSHGLLGAVLSHRALLERSRLQAGVLELTGGERLAGNLCLNFAHGLEVLWLALYLGAGFYLHRSPFPNDLARFLDHLRITHLPLMPVTVARLLHPRLWSPEPGLDLSSLRQVVVRGGALAGSLETALRKAFPDAALHRLYGQTETGVSAHLGPGEEGSPGTLGEPLPEVDLRVVDAEGAPCPPGVPGELLHTGPGAASGYWRSEEASRRIFRRSGSGPPAVRTGDRAVRERGGGLRFLGRLDSTIKSHGHRLSPRQIEEPLREHPGIMAAVAVGVDRAEVGQEIILVYSTVDHQPLDPGALQRYCSQRLPSFMLPTRFLYRPELPAEAPDAAGRERAAQVVRETVA